MLKRFNVDVAELGIRAAMALQAENRDSGPRIIGWTAPERRQ